MEIANIFHPDFSWLEGLPDHKELINPLLDILPHQKEDSHLMEFYKLSNPFYSPMFGVKYILNVNLLPYQMSMLLAVMRHKFPLILMTRGGGKTFFLAVYALYHAIMFPYSRIILVSASFRQSKLIFAEIERIYDSSPLLRQMTDYDPKHNQDSWKFGICGSTITALPMGQGDKIRGERGHVIIADEFDSIPIEIFDIVIRGFGATQANPWHKVKEAAESGGEISPLGHNNVLGDGNKIILTGTAGSTAGTLFKMFTHYSKIIANKVSGLASTYDGIFDDNEIHDDYEVDYRDYCICRYKWREIPAGMMDHKLIQNNKATMPPQLFNMEYETEFLDDSIGYFSQRAINEATSCPPEGFSVLTEGKPNRHYIMGVDPARTQDRFAISVIEMGSPNKLVYQWTCQNETYGFSARKMRQLMRKFNIVGISMDAGGGGLTMEEMINITHDQDGNEIRRPDEPKIYRMDDETPDALRGLRILYMQNFNSQWLDEANTLLRNSIEDRSVMFPLRQSQFSHLEEIDDIQFEIQQLKRELIAIGITYTVTGRKSFDLKPMDLTTTEVIYHKDRYSCFLLSNYLCERLEKINFDEKQILKDMYDASDTFGGWTEDF